MRPNLFTPGEARSLYIHFPFCERKCHYCDFYSIVREGASPAATNANETFEGALRAEAQDLRPFLAQELDTVFFGGGTPSLTSAESMRRALDPIWASISGISGTSQLEWTMEANPSSLTLESLRAYRELGINRLSMGVQSLKPTLLEKLGRVHSREKALKALEQAFTAGFRNISVDLLCGVPGQSIEDLEDSVSELLAFPITHLSCYLLTLAPGNPLFDELPNEDEQLEHYLWLHDRMTRQGFEHYEISNFARPGHRARHNLNYWKGRSYLGLGPSAHSYDARQGTRWKNASSLESYLRLIRTQGNGLEWIETLTPEQRELERWMLALRTEEGIPCSWLDNRDRQSWAAQLEAQRLLESHPALAGRKRLTPKGFALSDQIIAALA